jgi:hypothetical protein
MVRLFAFLSASVIASTLLWLGLYGAERLPLIIQSHMSHMHFGRFVPVWIAFAFPFFPIIIAVFVARKEERAKRDEDVPLTPMVRRLPSGLREL